MTIIDRIAEYSEEHGLFDCDVIIAGCSGGPDSMALMEILSDLKESGRINCDIRCVHINHNLRPGDCIADQELVSSYCKDRGIPLKIFSFDVSSLARANKLSEETQGRKLRYKAFSDYKDEIGPGLNVRIATAHHMDDLAETMLMNLFRGAGLKGLITPRPIAGDIIRPLLCVRKAELEGFLTDRGIRFATDSTNELSCCTRNVWRNDIIPEIAKSRGLSDDPVRQLYKTNLLLEEDWDFIETEALKAFSQVSDGDAVRVSGITGLHKSIRSRILRMLWLNSFDSLTDLESVNIEYCDKALMQEGSVELDMPFARKFIKHGDLAMFTSVPRDAYFYIAGRMGYLTYKEPLSLDISSGLETVIGDLSIRASIVTIENKDELEYNNYSWFYPLNNKRGEITITNALANASDLDLCFAKAGQSGSKKIRRLYTDLKIPKLVRDCILYVRSGDKILWIPGYGHSEGFTSSLSRSRYIEQAPECNRLLQLEIRKAH